MRHVSKAQVAVYSALLLNLVLSFMLLYSTLCPTEVIEDIPVMSAAESDYNVHYTKDGWYIEYKKDGELHRTDGPAYVDSTGIEVWYFNGKIHRENGPAMVLDSQHYAYLKNDKFDRDDGPAIVMGSYEAWCKDGKLHRDDGPAVTDGNHLEWWVHGEKLQEEDQPEFSDFWDWLA